MKSYHNFTILHAKIQDCLSTGPCDSYKVVGIKFCLLQKPKINTFIPNCYVRLRWLNTFPVYSSVINILHRSVSTKIKHLGLLLSVTSPFILVICKNCLEKIFEILPLLTHSYLRKSHEIFLSYLILDAYQ